MPGGVRWSEEAHNAWKAREAARTVTAIVPASVQLILPWPPTGNTGTRHANGAHYLTPEHRAYRALVANIAFLQKVQPVEGRLRVTADFVAADKRRRDLDNVWKVVGDALQHANVYPDDSAIDELLLRRLASRPDAPCVYVQVAVR